VESKLSNSDVGKKMLRDWILLSLTMLTIGPLQLPAAEPANVGLDLKSAVALCRDFLASADDEERLRLNARLATFHGDFDAVIQALRSRNYPAVKPGYYEELKFQSPAANEKYPKDLLYFIVPETYHPSQPTGLIVFMHGGGYSTSRDAPLYTMKLPANASDTGDYRSGKMLAATGMITVGPSAPGKGESSYRWCLKASEEYLVEVIQDCKTRFNIDPDRVFLLGHSMGGFGAYHHALRQPDRFASIIVSSGSWDVGYWPVIRGTLASHRHPACAADT
jgi:acetyl esterase/lipase